ncbi:hypothetical protein ONS95_007567 [Cadophora gregata]|uniref:uncharacterized protein n=1 Tax=Cadophora gregata TaxID=51156 RepID=UPI0026DC66AC|nr:uncharacterized protein ONS95_007567 [Cadophora gregata]KAK0125944.1 hypothetical protein ONS95_007567 [Cadophora gregata]
MPPPQHKWTQFELHTMLCLIAKGVHLEQRPDKRTEAPTVTRANAYENFYSALNDAVHRKNYTSDIPKKEVTRMLDQMLAERKHVAGKGGLVERQRNGRVTRALRMAWNREPAIDFDGTQSEWKQGRKEKVMTQYKIERGLMAPLVEGAMEGTAEDGDAAMTSVATITQDNFWKGSEPATLSTSDRSRWRSETDRGFDSRNPDMVPVKQPSLTKTNLDSFRVLPENLRSSSKFDWTTDRAANRDNYTRSDQSTTDRPLKRAGIRTRDLSRTRGSETSDYHDKPERMRLPYESYRSSRDDPVTPDNLNKYARRSDNYTAISRYSSTPGFIDDASSTMGLSPEVETPVFRGSNNYRVQSHGDNSPLRAFNESFEKEMQGGIPKDFGRSLEQDLANELSKDISMGHLEADLAAALESH